VRAELKSPERLVVKAKCTLTIVVANYNHGHFLPRCLDAILAQTRPPDEILMIDDASTDNSSEVISEFSPKIPKLKTIYHTTRTGVVGVMNEGLVKASSTHVLFAAADDWIEPELVSELMSLFENFPAAGVCSALTRLADEAGNVTGPFRTRIPLARAGYISTQRAAQLLLADDAWFNGNTTIVNRAAALQVGGYRPELNAYTDMFLNVTLALRFGACFTPRFLAVWRRLSDGVAASLTGSPVAMKSTFASAQTLMATLEPKVFERRYVARWAARWRFTIARSIVHTVSADKEDVFSDLLSSRALRIAVVQMARIPLIGKSTAVALLFVTLRPHDILPVLKRRTAWMLRARLMRAA